MTIFKQGWPVYEDCDIDPTATICQGARIGKNVTVGPGSVIHPNSVIGDNVTIGCNTVLGGNGYTFDLTDPNKPKRKLPTSPLVVEEYVEIGSNCVIDAGTTIGAHAKIDNHCSVAHDCRIGRAALLVNGAILGGHVTMGDRARVYMNAVIKNRAVIGDDAIIGMGVNLIDNVLPGQKISILNYTPGKPRPGVVRPSVQGKKTPAAAERLSHGTATENQEGWAT